MTRSARGPSCRRRAFRVLRSRAPPLDAEQKSFDATADALLNKGGLAFDFDRYEVMAGTKRGDDLEGSAAWDNMFGRAGSDALPDAKALCAGRLFDPLLESSRRAFWED
jgi:hypothetical protein